MSTVRVDATALRDWSAAVLGHCGMSAADAAQAAGFIVRTSLRGIDTHGLARMSIYAEKLLRQEVAPRAVPRVEASMGGLRLEGGGAMGQIAVPVALRAAMDLQHAAVACAIANYGHLGALGVLLLEACERGFVALLCQQTPPIMALPGSRGAAIGNNPIAFAAPVTGRDPFVFDMACSEVARGHVLQARREARSIPDHWAIGADGKPTSDPAAALRGAMRPLAGHKGMGLAMMVECLAGCLSGALQGPAPDNAGSAAGIHAFLLVLDPDRFAGRAAFDASMQAWIDHHAAASGAEARYPGQRQAACERERARNGIPLAAALLADLRATSAACRVTFPSS